MLDLLRENGKASSSKADDFRGLELGPEHRKHLLIGQPQDNIRHQKIPLRSHSRPKRHLPRQRKCHDRAGHNAPAHQSTVRKSNVGLRRSNQPIRKLLYTSTPRSNRVGSATVERRESIASGYLWIFRIFLFIWTWWSKTRQKQPAIYHMKLPQGGER
jgi:hypothetical protein